MLLAVPNTLSLVFVFVLGALAEFLAVGGVLYGWYDVASVKGKFNARIKFVTAVCSTSKGAMVWKEPLFCDLVEF